MNLQDVIDQYKARVTEEEKEMVQAQEQTQERETLRTFSDFQKIDLMPDVVEGPVATFYLDGKTIQFVRRANEYTIGYVRLLGPCPKCGEDLVTDIWTLSAYNVGHLIVNPDPRYHSCEPQQKREQVKPPKTITEQLISALDAYIEEKTHVEY